MGGVKQRAACCKMETMLHSSTQLPNANIFATMRLGTAGSIGLSALPEAAGKLCLTDNAADNAACWRRAAVDAGAVMGRSFGVTWGPNNTFLHPGELKRFLVPLARMLSSPNLEACDKCTNRR